MRAAGSAVALVLAACAGDGPQLDEVTPSTVARGGAVMLRGARFCQAAGTTPDGACAGPVTGAVDLGLSDPVRATITAWRDDAIGAEIPAGAPTGTVEIYVTSSGVSSNALEIVIQ